MDCGYRDKLLAFHISNLAQSKVCLPYDDTFIKMCHKINKEEE